MWRNWIGCTIISLALLASLPARALSPDRTITQFKHSFWSAEQGVPAGISAIAQDRTGFLWLAARDGMFRFDSLTFEAVPIINPEHPLDRPMVLLARGDGSMWAALFSGSIVSYAHGAFRRVRNLDLRLPVVKMEEDRDRALWIALGDTYDGQVLRFSNGRRQYYGRAQGLPNDQIIGILAASDGAIWVSFHLGAIMVLRPGATRFAVVAINGAGHSALTQDRAGRVWSSDDIGTRQIWANGAFLQNAKVYRSPRFDRAARAFWDDENNLWLVDGRSGIARLTDPLRIRSKRYGPVPGSLEFFTATQGLTSNGTNGAMTDRDGSVWVATSAGLDRFRAADSIIEPLLVNVPAFGDVLLGASDGSVYIAEQTTLYRVLPTGKPEAVLRYDVDPEALCERRDHSIAIVLETRIALLRSTKVRWIPAPPFSDDTLHYGCADDSSGNLWVSSGKNGIFRWINGRWENYLNGDRKFDLRSSAMASDPHHRIALLRGPTRLGEVAFPSIRSVPIGEGTAVDIVESIMWTPQGLMAGGPFGLALWRDKRLEVMPAARNPSFSHTYGMVQTPDGETWLRTHAGIVRIPTAALLASLKAGRNHLKPTFFSREDGVDEGTIRGSHQNVALGGDGRLWFGGRLGTRWIDPHHLVRIRTAPGVAISAVVVNGSRYRDPTKISLPAGTSDLQVDFAALSLSRPDRIHVRYQLEGVDKGWVDPGTRRSAFYTSLEPGDYTFKVRANTDDGLVSATDATVGISLPATFRQSTWFKLLFALPLGLLLWAIYRLRLNFLTSRMRDQLEARLAERERIARELHDTLLQGFQGLIFHFQSIADKVSGDRLVRGEMNAALDRADEMMVEGRRRVQDLRTKRSTLRIDVMLTELGETLAKDFGAGFRLTVEGRDQPMTPLARDEAEAIAGEAIRNAFCHGGAKLIDVAIGYHSREFLLTVSDDGCGLPSDIAAAGSRAGHYGLSGMRERANRVQGKLSITSRTGAGTQISLCIPESSAYSYRGKFRSLAPWIAYRGWRTRLISPT